MHVNGHPEDGMRPTMGTKYDVDDIGGWAVSVWTERLGGGQPMLCLYAATFTDASDAVSLVRERYGLLPDGDTIGLVYPLSKGTVEALGMEPGEVDVL